MITIFQHGTGEPPGYALDIIKKMGLEYEIIRFFAGEQVPERITRYPLYCSRRPDERKR